MTRLESLEAENVRLRDALAKARELFRRFVGIVPVKGMVDPWSSFEWIAHAANSARREIDALLSTPDAQPPPAEGFPPTKDGDYLKKGGGEG